jgi:hypothetical protein
MRSARLCGAILALVLLLAGVPRAQAAIDLAIAGNTATAQIALGPVEAEFILSFDAVEGLGAADLGLSAQLVSPTDPLLLARLPEPGVTAIPAALPLLITVEPPAGSALALRNTVRVEVHTHALPYTAGSHFRLFKAPLGGSFVDITDEVAPGSVRTRGTTGGFSQFLVLVDLRATSAVVDSKFTALQARTVDAPALLRGSLLERLAAARSASSSGQYAAAIAALDDFRALVSANAGTALGNQWTPAARGGNLAGDLLAAAASLRFSIGYLRDYGN